MEACVDPSGHNWEESSSTTFAGATSTFVFCVNEGCEETGYRLGTQVIEADRGNDNDEGLF